MSVVYAGGIVRMVRWSLIELDTSYQVHAVTDVISRRSVKGKWRRNLGALGDEVSRNQILVWIN